VGVLVGPVAEALVGTLEGRLLSELFGGDEGLCLGLTVGKLVGRDVAYYGGFIDDNNFNLLILATYSQQGITCSNIGPQKETVAITSAALNSGRLQPLKRKGTR
jgi:hypothetical protein